MFQIGAAGTDPLKDNLRSNFNSFKKKFNSNIFFQYYSTLGTQNFIYIYIHSYSSFVQPPPYVEILGIVKLFSPNFPFFSHRKSGWESDNVTMENH